MVLKLYGVYRSPWARLVAAILYEKQVPFELVPVTVDPILSKGENKKPEYLAKHPYGEIPYIDDDGFILYESKAICYYIASKYPNQGTPLLPSEIQANALYQQAVFVELSHFHQHGVLAALVGHGTGRHLAPNKEAFEKHIADLSGKLDVYDKTLGKQKYLLGDEISLIDLYHLPIGTYLGMLGSDVMQSKPNVARWIKDLSSRESWACTEEEARNCRYIKDLSSTES